MKSTWTGLPAGADDWAPGAFARMHECAGGFCGPHPFWSRPEHLHARWPGSNTFSTAHDMARFYGALLDGGRGVVPGPFVNELSNARPVARMDATFRRPMRFHLGFLFDSKQEGESWHSYGYGAAAGPRSFGHGGNQCAVAFADPDRGVVVAAAFNGMPGELAHQQRMRRLLAAVEAALDQG
jgi:CubicO group peptidase (beta-lactamase class C family)